MVEKKEFTIRKVSPIDIPSNVIGDKMPKKHYLFSNIIRASYGIAAMLLGTVNIATAQTEPVTYSADGTAVTYSQNDIGPSFDIRDARGVTTVLQYDNLGRVIREDSAERGLTEYSYDIFGNIIRQISEGGLIFKRDYDDQNRLTREIMKQNGVDRKVHTYTYDICENGAGLICKVVSDGHVTKYAYTEDQSIASVSTRYSGQDDFETTRYSYDSSGRAIKLHYPTGLTVRYHYSDDDYVTKVTGRYETGEDRETFVIAKNLKFNPDKQRLTALTYGNGLKTKFNYSAANKLQSIKTLINGEVINQSSYTRDDTGNITEINRLNAAGAVRYGYDGYGRLISEQKGLDAESQYTISYNYDAVGNRVSYDNGNKQNSYVYGPQTNRLDVINRKLLSYDVRGNLVSDRKGKRSFAYDVTNRMTAFYKDDELRASYDYNAFGQRIAKTLHRPQRGDDSYRSLHFAYSPDGWLLSEFGRDSDKKRNFARDYVWLGSRPLAQIERKMRPDGTTRKAKVSFLHTDHLNTPRWATNISGETVWRWNSDGFGKGKADRDVDGDGKNTVIRLRFAGQYHDRESGLYYNHHRDYDPNLGRYIQSDPIGLNGGINRYVYVLGNPISYIDPKGLSTYITYNCVTTALSDGNGGWVPGSNITNCTPVFNEIPEYDTLGLSGAENYGDSGYGGGITQVADASGGSTQNQGPSSQSQLAADVNIEFNLPASAPDDLSCLYITAERLNHIRDRHSVNGRLRNFGDGFFNDTYLTSNELFLAALATYTVTVPALTTYTSQLRSYPSYTVRAEYPLPVGDNGFGLPTNTFEMIIDRRSDNERQDCYKIRTAYPAR